MAKRAGKANNNQLVQFIVVFILLAGAGFSLYLVKTNNAIWPRVKGLFIELTSAGGHKDDSRKALNLVDGSSRKMLMGIDMSHYQGRIDWSKLNGINSSTPISFIFLRATMGKNGNDRHFEEYWIQAKWKGIARGAYHYFRPNEPGKEQAEKFISTVKLEKGDLPPVVDIEKEPRKRRISLLRKELKIFLDIVEKHYGVRPIIYTMDSFFCSYLSNGDFDDYPLWIANYNLASLPQTSGWTIWQFSDKGKIDGVDEYVDLNLFRGSREEFDRFLIR